MSMFRTKRMVSRRFGPSIASTTSVSLKTNLVAFYLCNDAYNTSMADAHGSKTLSKVGAGDLDSVAGKIGNARQAVGSAGASRADDPDFEPGAGKLFFTTFWAKAGSLTQATLPGLIGKFNGGANQREWCVLFNDTLNTAKLYVSSDGVTTTTVDASTAFTDTSTWLFIAAGYDGSEIKISVNGGAFATNSFSGNIYESSARFGVFVRENDTVFFNGALDEVGFWKGRCLTLAEVQQIYNGGSGLSYSSWT